MSAQDVDPYYTAMLDPSELEALSDDGYSEEEKAALAKLANATDEELRNPGGGDDDDDQDGDDDSTASVVPPIEIGSKQDASNTETGPANTTIDQQDDDGDGPIDEPIFARVELPADYDEQVKSLSEQKKALREQLKLGDIDIDEYESKIDLIDEKKAELSQIKLKHDLSQEAEQNFYQNQWQKTVNGFMRTEAKQGVIDYNKDDEKRKDLDTFVRILGADERNSNRSMDWFLKEAHKRVLALHGIQGNVQTPGKASQFQKQDAISKAKEARKSPVAAAPANLSQVPGSDGPGDVDGEFADLDALEGTELEDALNELARKNPSAFNRYKAGL